MALPISSINQIQIKPKETTKELLIKVMAGLYEITAKSGIEKDEIFKLVEHAIVNKKQIERIRDYSLELGKFLEKGFVVLRGNPEVMLKQLKKYIKHAENVWNDAETLYKRWNNSRVNKFIRWIAPKERKEKKKK